MTLQEKDEYSQDTSAVTDADFLGAAEELEETRSKIVRFLRRRAAAAGVDGAVVAMSGGIDSTLTAMLTVEALGSDRVLGLGLPCNKLDSYHMTDARTIADGLGIEFREIHLQPLLDTFEDVVIPPISTQENRRAIGNVIARLRMLCVYYAANAQSRFVVGTSNRSELLLGYFTKYGDGAADVYPLGDLYKTEVRALAQHVGLPRRIIHKTPTAGLCAGQTDEDDIGAPYSLIDQLLQRMIDCNEDVNSAADTVGVDLTTAEQIADMYVGASHKRSVPPTPRIGNRSNEIPPHLLLGAGEPK